MRNLPPLLNKDKNECPRTLPEEWLVETLSPGGRPHPPEVRQWPQGSGRALCGQAAAGRWSRWTPRQARQQTRSLVVAVVWRAELVIN